MGMSRLVRSRYILNRSSDVASGCRSTMATCTWSFRLPVNQTRACVRACVLLQSSPHDGSGRSTQSTYCQATSRPAGRVLFMSLALLTKPIEKDTGPSEPRCVQYSAQRPQRPRALSSMATPTWALLGGEIEGRGGRGGDETSGNAVSITPCRLNETGSPRVNDKHSLARQLSVCWHTCLIDSPVYLDRVAPESMNMPLYVGLT